MGDGVRVKGDWMAEAVVRETVEKMLQLSCGDAGRNSKWTGAHSLMLGELGRTQSSEIPPTLAVRRMPPDP